MSYDVESCARCRHWNAKERECWRYPPMALPMPRPNPLTGEIKIGVTGVHPPVPDTWWCGEFAAKGEDA